MAIRLAARDMMWRALFIASRVGKQLGRAAYNLGMPKPARLHVLSVNLLPGGVANVLGRPLDGEIAVGDTLGKEMANGQWEYVFVNAVTPQSGTGVVVNCNRNPPGVFPDLRPGQILLAV